jgi:hypothetical protein
MGLWMAVTGLCMASVAIVVSVEATAAADLLPGPHQTCVAVALCLGFHIGMALVTHGVATRHQH